MKQKFYSVTARLIRETDKAVQMDLAHADYGVFPGTFVPKSVIDDESLELIAESADGDDIEIYIAAWWIRRNLDIEDPDGRRPR